MRNILAIASKELKSYFASPIAYIVIGFFALLFGYFFYRLPARLRRAEHADGADAAAADVNINQQMIRRCCRTPR